MRAGRPLHAIIGALLVASGLVAASGVAAATTATVSTEAELRAALADGATTSITLANSITLADCSAGGGDLDRAGALTLDGAGFTIRQTCPGERVLQSTSGTLTLQNVTITGGDQTGTGVVLGGGVLAADDLLLDATTVTDNTVTADGWLGNAGAFGGGVEADGAITLVASHVDGNTASSTAGSYGAGVASGAGADVTINASTVDSNTAEATDATKENTAANGGGVAVVTNHDDTTEILDPAGTVHVVSSSVSGNVERTLAAGLTFTIGGGIFADNVVLESSHLDVNELHPTSTGSQGAGWGGGVLSTTLRATDSTLDRNVVAPDGPDESAEGGGAWSASGSIALADSSASGNTVTVTTRGQPTCAGLLTEALTLNRATVSDNRASGGIRAIGGGACAGPVSIESSTLSGNTATSAADDAWGGGGVFGTGTIRNSTVSGNSVSGATARGGALSQVQFSGADTPGDLALVNSTVTGNDATGAASSGGGIDLPGQIDGFPPDAGTVSLIFSTVVANEATSGANIAASAADGAVTSFTSTISQPLGGGANCDGFSIDDTGDNQITDTSCGTAASADPQLGALADNGGPTLTMLPAATSPLLDQVPTTACLALVTVDQRGVTRPQGKGCDVGAVERDVAPLVPVNPPAVAPTAVGIVPRFTG